MPDEPGIFPPDREIFRRDSRLSRSSRKSREKGERERGAQNKTEDAGRLPPVKDVNTVMRLPDRRTFLSILGHRSKSFEVR